MTVALATSPENDSYSVVQFHEGQALLRIAGTYPTIQGVILEEVQNALDVMATHIWIELDYQKRCLWVRDNGCGIQRVEFEAALRSVCLGRKERGKLERYGIGLISPLGKCETFTFVSCAEPGTHGFTEWLFNAKQIGSQAKAPQIPFRLRHDLTLDQRRANRGGTTMVSWRTEICLQRFTEDRVINRVTLAGLVDAIIDRFRIVMLRSNVKVSIRITDENGHEERRDRMRAPRFVGTKLPEVVLTNSDGGLTTFRLFLAKRIDGRKRGRVVVGESDNDFRFPFPLFYRSVIDLLPDDIGAALSSGVFEGEILTEKARLHENRRSFVKSSALVGFCVAIEQWFRATGANHLESAKENREEERYQELGLKTMERLEELLHDKDFQSLREVLQKAKRGTVGTGHTEPEDKQIVGAQEETAVSLQGQHDPIPPKSEKKKPTPEPIEPSREREKHVPLTVVGPKGQIRRLVKSNSLGLQFVHDKMEGSDRVWVFEPEIGLLRFNIRHPLWVRCRARDQAILRLQEFIAIQALTLQTLPTEWYDQNLLAMEELLPAFVYLLTSGESQRPPRKSGKK